MNRNLILLFVACSTLTGLGGSQPAVAQDSIVKTYRLSLDEATHLAIENNFDIQLTQYDAWIARTDKDGAESIYDTILEAEIKYRNNQEKQTSTLLGTKALDNDYNLGVSKKFPTGTIVSVDLDNNRHWSNSAFTTSALSHDSTLGLTVEQALGKNIFGIQDRGNVKITLKDIEQAEYTSLNKIEGSIAEVQRVYWDLVLAIENEDIQEAMVDEARRLYDLHQGKLKDGLVEIPEAIASEANYKSRENALLLARNEAAAKENILRLLLNVDDRVLIEPTAHLTLPDHTSNLTESLGHAFEARQDYKGAVNDITAKDITLSMNKNNLWPEINLTATLENNGLGDHFKQAVTQISEENNPNFFAGLTITFPLENREAKSAVNEAELKQAKAVLALKLLERQIAIEVADEVRNCNVYHQHALNAQEVARLQVQKLKEEEKRYSYGRSDTDTLIRFQEDAVRAKGAVAQAMHRYYTALVTLHRKEGGLLKSYWDRDL